MASSSGVSAARGAGTRSPPSIVHQQPGDFLSPNVALESAGQQQRRRSTLSSHGFFIDYSNTRRRSSTAARDHQNALARQSHALRSYAGAASAAAGASQRRNKSICMGSQPNSPSRNTHRLSATPVASRQSRASCSAASASGANFKARGSLGAAHHCGSQRFPRSSLLLPSALHVLPSALAGSRKTSIFDPTGHSVAPHILARRKSTMVCGPKAPSPPASAAPAVLLSAAKLRPCRKGELGKHVPVIGCSPTSIQASLAALEEARRCEKLVRRVRRHERRKEKERQARRKSRLQADSSALDQEGGTREQQDQSEQHQWRPTASLRRKSLRAIQSAADMLSGRRHDDMMDGLSMSTMSFISGDSSLESDCDADSLGSSASLTSGSAANANSNSNADAARPKLERDAPTKRSFVRSAMRKIASTIAGSQQPVDGSERARAKTSGRAPGGVNYWYHYYCYLRECSLEASVDELPVSVAEAPNSDAEHRARLYINYSLARTEILNANSDPVAKLASKLARVEAAEELEWERNRRQQQQQQDLDAQSNQTSASAGGTSSHLQQSATGNNKSPISGLLFDFSQSTDVSLTLSTSTLDSSSTSRNSMSLSSVVSLSADSADSSSVSDSPANNKSLLGRPLPSGCSQCATGTGAASADSLGLPKAPGSQASSPQHSAGSSGHSRRSLAVVRGAETSLSSEGGDANLGGDERRQPAATRFTRYNCAAEIGGDSERRLRPERPATGRSQTNLLALDLPLSLDSSKRSASFANTCSSSPAAASDNEEELDDFERFQRSHRGYQQQQRRQHNSLPLDKSPSQRKGLVPPSLPVGETTISARGSSARLSIRNHRPRASDQSSSGVGERRECARNNSLSWDALAARDAPPAPGACRADQYQDNGGANAAAPDGDERRPRGTQRHLGAVHHRAAAAAEATCGQCARSRMAETPSARLCWPQQTSRVDADNDGADRSAFCHVADSAANSRSLQRLAHRNLEANDCRRPSAGSDSPPMDSTQPRVQRIAGADGSERRAHSHSNVVGLRANPNSRLGEDSALSRRSLSASTPTHRSPTTAEGRGSGLAPQHLSPNSCENFRQAAGDVTVQVRSSAADEADQRELRARAHSTGTETSDRQALQMAANYARGQASEANPRQQSSRPTEAADSIVDSASIPPMTNTNSGSVRGAHSAGICGDDDDRDTVEILNKNSFTCTLIGARQTGKRTIVKCFVKILNEFKIAVDEYKKEQMLSKLIDCSEKLQELTERRQQEQEDRGADSGVQRSRINSWLGGISMQKLMGQNKRRLHSTVGIPSRDSQPQQPDQQRRHTAIEQIIVGRPSVSDAAASSNQDAMFRFNGHLSPGGLAFGQQFNKSDSNINYDNDDGESIPMTQLRVPTLAERKVSDPGSVRISHHDNRLHTCSSTNLPLLVRQEDADSRVFEADVTRRRSSYLNRARRRRKMVSLKELNKRRCKIKFKTRRQISSYLLVDEDSQTTDATILARRQQVLRQNLADSFFVIYAINDRLSFEFAKGVIAKLRLIKYEYPIPIVLVANKIDLERAKVVKSEEGRTLAKKFACKFIEISCTVGFNLDNLLVGLRTQLILKHHLTLKNIFKEGKPAPQSAKNEPQKTNNILMRFYKRYMVDNSEQNYDCDNFSKL